jgi:hypothetical protein
MLHFKLIVHTVHYSLTARAQIYIIMQHMYTYTCIEKLIIYILQISQLSSSSSSSYIYIYIYIFHSLAHFVCAYKYIYISTIFCFCFIIIYLSFIISIFFLLFQYYYYYYKINFMKKKINLKKMHAFK